MDLDVKEFYRKVNGRAFVIVGHFNSEEVRQLIVEGYKVKKAEKPQFNKNGIRIVR